MDYKQKYEEALERARDLHDNHPLGQPQTWMTCEKIFPELRESEDERIRKELIEQVVYIVPNDDEVDSEGNVLPIYQKRIDKYLAWLEKQGEQKPVERNETRNIKKLNWLESDFDYAWKAINLFDTCKSKAYEAKEFALAYDFKMLKGWIEGIIGRLESNKQKKY